MKKCYLLICLIFVSATLFSQWTWQNPLIQGNVLNSIYFTDANTGYA